MENVNVNGKIDINVKNKSNKRNNIEDGWTIEKEIDEHKKDCAVNRSVHFKAHQRYDKKCKRIKFWSCILTLITVAGLMLFISFKWRILVTIILPTISIISLLISIVGMVYDYESKSRENWQAAQSYQALYRDCQFYDYEKDSQCEYEVAERIRKHLNNLNMIAPSVSSKDYREVNSGM